MSHPSKPCCVKIIFVAAYLAFLKYIIVCNASKPSNFSNTVQEFLMKYLQPIDVISLKGSGFTAI